MVLSNTSDDDESVIPPPPSTETPPPAVPVGAETREWWRAREATAAVLDDARGTTAAVARTGGRVFEQAQATPAPVYSSGDVRGDRDD